MSPRIFVQVAVFLLLGSAAAHAQSKGTQPIASADTPTRTPIASTPASSNPAHAGAAPAAQAMRLDGTVHVDGRLDEAIWQTVPPITRLIQLRPNEGREPSQRTEVRVAYDAEAIYVGARMYDDDPSGIVGRLARRDEETGSDYILIQFDPYHNHNGDASFSLTAAGGRWDGGNGDVSWDPVWEGKAQVDSLGWTAEMRIPF